MSDDDNWLPPRARAVSGTLTDETPETHAPPALADVSPDDPAVLALVSPLPDSATPLPALDDNEFVTPPVIHDLARLLDPARANAEIAAVAPQKTQEQRLAALELTVLSQGNQITNLSEMFKLYLHGKSL